MNKQQNIILIVDDTPENLRVLGELLEAAGHEVRVATNGVHALEIAHSSRVDLILLDIMMPEMDGYEVCTKLKKDAQTKEIPIVFLTALDAFEDEAKGLKLGAIDYITKPFKLELVKTRVLNHLALHNARQELKYKNEKLEEIVAARTKELEEAHRRLLTIDSAKYDFLQLIYQKLWAPDKGILPLTQAAFSLLNSASPNNTALQKRYDESQTQLFETINNALLMAGSHEGDAEPDKYPILLDVVLNDTLSKLKQIAQSKEISFNLNMNQKGIIGGDLDLVFHALTTVIHAALLMAKTASTIGIKSEALEKTVSLEVTLQAEIPPEDDIHTLFDQTSRFHSSSVGRELGLAVPLSSKIIQAMGGSIFVEKRVGKKYVMMISLKKFSKKRGVRIELS